MSQQPADDLWHWIDTWVPDLLADEYGSTAREVDRVPAGFSKHIGDLPDSLRATTGCQAAEKWLRTGIKARRFPKIAITLAGPTGTGKTSVLAALWYDLPAISCRRALGFWPARRLAEYLRAPGFGQGERIFRRKNVSEGVTLCIDDLGAEPVTDWDRELMQALIEERHDLGFSTFVTTNLSADALTERYGQRTIDRLLSRSRLIPMVGESHRPRA